MANAIIETATGRVVGWGHMDFSALLGPGQEQVDVTGAPPDGVPMRHLRVVGGAFAIATAGQRVAADAADAAEKQAAAAGAVVIERVVTDASELPLPPPRAGLLVGMRDGGSGVPAIAVSSSSRWAVFDADRVVGP